MTDATEDEAAANAADAMRENMRKLMKRFSPGAPVKEKAARKQREKKAKTIVDGRTLRAKGRTAQINIKARPEVKDRLMKFAEAEGLVLADWFEQLVEELPVRD
jgi:hypothetical protein